MLYYNDELVNWQKTTGLTDIEKQVREEILGSGGIKDTYFGDHTDKKVILLYPKGAPSSDETAGWEMKKLYPIPLNSSDGQWRWSSARRSTKGYVDHHKNIRHNTQLTIKDIEFIWFLKNRSSVLNRVIFIQDLEKDAYQRVEEMGDNVGLRFMLFAKESPIFKNEELIRQVAEILGVRNTDEMRFNQVKTALYDAVIEGEKMKDPYCNYERFSELTNGESMRKSAYLARVAISDKIVGYKASERAWYIMAGREYEEKLLSLKNQTEAQFKEQKLIEEVVYNQNVQNRLLSAMGETLEETCDTLRELDHKTLKARYRDLTGEYKNINKEELVEKICAELNIDYVPV